LVSISTMSPRARRRTPGSRSARRFFRLLGQLDDLVVVEVERDLGDARRRLAP
jgi:hypothetical protein